MKPTLIYCYDALCGWCYGFSPVIQRISHEFATHFDVEILSGGMVLDERAGPIGKVAPYVKMAYKSVESHTGVSFGAPFLADLMGPGSLMMNSWRPALALTAFKNMQAGSAVAFGSALQRGIYQDGISPEDDRLYETVAAAFTIKPEDLLDFMLLPSIADQTKAEFQRVASYGVTGFPTLLIAFEQDYAHLVSGYRSYETLAGALNRLATNS
jgi:putative protein-disulfide isomerase